MTRHRTGATRLGAALIGIGVIVGVGLAPSADAAAPHVYKNCAQLNAKYPHGVGLPGAHDKKKSGKAVTSFYRNKALYLANKQKLDRDRDGIACEK